MSNNSEQVAKATTLGPRRLETTQFVEKLKDGKPGDVFTADELKTVCGKSVRPCETIEHVCKIIAYHHSAKDINTLEFRVIWDADWLVNIPDECGRMSKEKLKGFIEKIFRTAKGRQLAGQLYLKGYCFA